MASWAIATVLGATGTLELELRSEARGVDGGPAGARLVEPVPGQLEATVGLSGELEPRLRYAVALTPRLLLVAGPDGRSGVDGTRRYLSGSTSLSWRASHRATLALTASGARGTLSLSPLSQLSAAGAPPGGAEAGGVPPQPGGGTLDPAAGLRLGAYASAAARAAVEWRATPTLSLGGGLAAGRSGGLGPDALLLFPAADTFTADGRTTLSVSAQDGLELQASYARTALAAQGSAAILDGLARWSRRLTHRLDAAVGAGAAVTVEDHLVGSTGAPTGRLAPRVELTLAVPPPPGDRGLALSALLGLAPYVDQYAGAVRQRITGSADLSWRVERRVRLSALASGATALGAGGQATTVAAAEVGGWYRWGEVEVGLTARGGVQVDQAPAATVRQWSAGVASRWRQGPAP